MRPQQCSAVGHGGDRRHQLQGRQREVLAEGIDRKVYPAAQIEDAELLAGQIHAGLAADAEGGGVIPELLDAQRLTNGHQRRVAGVFQGVPQGLIPVAALFPAADGAAPALDELGAGAVEMTVFRDHALLQRRGHGDDLEGGAGVIEEGNALVAPHLVDRVASGLFPGLLVFDGGHLRLLFLAEDEGMVGVVFRIGGHGKDAAVVHIHDHADGRALYLIVAVGDLQVLFQIMLQHLVDGEHQRRAVLGFVIKLIVLGDGIAVGIGQRDRPARRPRKELVILPFQAGQALLIAAHAAQHAGQKAAIGIIAGGIRFKIEKAGIFIVLNELPHRVGLILFHAPEQHLIGAVLFRLLQDGLRIQLQQGGQGLHDGLQPLFPDGFAGLRRQLRLFVHIPGGQMMGLQIVPLFRAEQVAVFLRPQLPGAEDEHFRAGGDRQRLAVGIVNGAPLGIDGHIPRLAAEGLLLVKILTDDLQIGQSGQDRREAQDAEHHRQQLHPAFYMNIRFPFDLGHMRSFPWAGAVPRRISRKMEQGAFFRTLLPFFCLSL